jgi:hypothetical protein
MCCGISAFQESLACTIIPLTGYFIITFRKTSRLQSCLLFGLSTLYSESVRTELHGTFQGSQTQLQRISLVWPQRCTPVIGRLVSISAGHGLSQPRSHHTLWDKQRPTPPPPPPSPSPPPSRALLERPPVLQLLKTSQHFKESQGSLPRSKQPSTGPYPEVDQSSPYQPILSL